MKTLDDRAVALMGTLPCDEPKSLVYEAYRKGALDQHKIDIEKACEWWRKLTEKGNNHGIAYPVTDGWIDAFRKAMEE